MVNSSGFDASRHVSDVLTFGDIGNLVKEWKGDPFLKVSVDESVPVYITEDAIRQIKEMTSSAGNIGVNPVLSVNFFYVLSQIHGKSVITDFYGGNECREGREWNYKTLENVLRQGLAPGTHIGYGSIIYQDGRGPIFSAYPPEKEQRSASAMLPDEIVFGRNPKEYNPRQIQVKSIYDIPLDALFCAAKGYGYDMELYLSQQGISAKGGNEEAVQWKGYLEQNGLGVSPYHLIVVPSGNPSVCSVGVISGSLNDGKAEIEYHPIERW